MSRIKDLDSSQRPREKALYMGIDKLSDKELLALIIRCGVKNFSALELSENILNKYGSLSDLLKVDIFNLMQVKGIKKAKALELVAVLELAKRISREKSRNITYINSDKDVYDLLKLELENQIQEQFIVIFLNIKLGIIKKEILFIGGECSSLVDINLIFKKALECGARKFICVHNHPSGDPTPSQEDIILTKRIEHIGTLIKIQLIDHIIIGKNNYFSFKNSNN